jgi:hypothetical protein
MRRAIVLLGALALGAASACSVLVTTSGLSGGAAEAPDADAALDAKADVDGATGPLPSSCRALHATSPDAGSGPYDLALADGGRLEGYCDMESFDGGWTLVTPAMIVEDKAVQDYAPASPAKVDVARGSDVHGGVFFDAQVTAVNCANNNLAGPGHYFLVGELDGWTQIMASYTFTASTSCWNIFGDPPQKDPQSTNIHPFDLAVDLIGPQVNMARTMAGAAIPFDGRLQFCDETADNFWSGPYASDPKSARVVLRRFSQARPAGLGIATDCGKPGWNISAIHVR